MAYANEANIVNQDSSINEGRRGEGRGGKLSGWWPHDYQYVKTIREIALYF